MSDRLKKEKCEKNEKIELKKLMILNYSMGLMLIER